MNRLILLCADEGYAVTNRKLCRTRRNQRSGLTNSSSKLRLVLGGRTSSANMDDAAVESLLQGTGGKTRLERDKALAQLDAAIKQATANGTIDGLVTRLATGVRLMVFSSSWQQRLGGFLVAKDIMSMTDSQFAADLLEACMQHLEDAEVRVRLAIASCLFALAQQQGIAVWERTREPILHSVQCCLDRDTNAVAATPDAETDDDAQSVVSSGSYLDDLLSASYKQVVPGTGDLRHDTEGWRFLETSFKALQQVIEGCGPAIQPYITNDLLQLLCTSFGHKNRFVREIGYHILDSMARQLASGEGSPVDAYALEFAAYIRAGLSDDWSQVRYTAALAARSFLLATQHLKETVYPLVLPALCLNRHYLAEGVKQYCQATWMQVLGQQGRTELAAIVPQTVDYYLAQSRVSNHAARDAACACMAELMTKVDHAAVQPYVERMMQAILLCFKDTSWPTRDAACTAASQAIQAFPDDCKPFLPELQSLWLAHLGDNIACVREGAAEALGDAIRTYGDVCLHPVLSWLTQHMLEVQQQPHDPPTLAADISNRPGVAGVHKADEDRARFTNQPMFDCFSLAPKFSTSVTRKKATGCEDFGAARAAEPWELSDGAVYMIRVLAQLDPEVAVQFMLQLVELARVDGFQAAHKLHETLWKQLPKIMHAIGKRPFKQHLEGLVDPLFRSLKCGHRNCEVAAGEAAGSIRDFLGPNIFAGRLSAAQQDMMRTCPDIPPSVVYTPQLMGRS